MEGGLPPLPQLQLDRGLVEEPEPRLGLELELELGPELGQELVPKLVPGPLMVLVQGLGVVPVMELIPVVCPLSCLHSPSQLASPPWLEVEVEVELGQGLCW